MRASLATLSVALAVNMRSASAKATGEAQGFAAGVTGGGDAPDVFPKTTAELIAFLGDDESRNIVIDKEFNFIGTEGTATDSGCAPWGTGPQCQLAISLANDWCGREQPDAPKIASITYDKAGVTPIEVKSNKSLVGKGASASLRGKGLRLSDGVQNVIIQNIAVTDLNPDYVWGGDAISFRGADLVWLDHIHTSKIGRQHIVAGNGGAGRLTISNSVIDGRSEKSAQCSTEHYWNLLLIGQQSDQITLIGNHLRDMSGRGPKVGSGTLVHAVNNVWENIIGHAFETESGTNLVIEGNVFDGVKVPLRAGGGGNIFAANDASAAAQCESAMGRACEVNSLTGAGPFEGADANVLGSIKNAPPAVSASEAKTSVLSKAGTGKL